VIEEILGPWVSAAEAFDDLPGVVLFAEEEAVVAKAVDKRRREFATARACARQAMAALGQPSAPIVSGYRGAPQWPPGVVGSITHCDGYRAAAVARAADVTTLGVDAEPDEPLPDGVLDLVAGPEERAWLAGPGAATAGPCWDRLLFSAKESVYKAWFPLTRRWLDFSDAMLTFDPVTRTFIARLLVAGPVVGDRQVAEFAGRWLAHDGLILTAIVLPVR
jgi:4'-phosphopantetheinyl transferase EntD